MKTEIRIQVTSLPAEELTADLLALLCHTDERPLRGGVGRVDWRLCGQLSKLLVDGVISGFAGERALLPGGGTLRTPRVLLLGLGERATPALQQIDLALRGFGEVLRGLQFREAILDLPASWFAEAEAREIARLLGYRLRAGLDQEEAVPASDEMADRPYRIQLHVNPRNELRFRDALKREISQIPDMELDSPSVQAESGFSTRKSTPNHALGPSNS